MAGSSLMWPPTVWPHMAGSSLMWPVEAATYGWIQPGADFKEEPILRTDGLHPWCFAGLVRVGVGDFP